MLDGCEHCITSIRMKTDTATAPTPPHLQPVPPEPTETEFDQNLQQPQLQPRCYKNGKFVVVENGAVIPTHSCVKCGRAAKKSVSTGLRHTSNPLTWFGKRPRMDVGLCKRHHENHSVAVALTWSFIGVGAVLLVAGVLAFSIASMILGFVAITVSGIFRASSPVTSADATADYASIAGTCESYRKRLSRHQ